jgi:hypothetical protein
MSAAQTQAPRCYRKSRGRCAVCHRATEASELLWFLFCPGCYAIILSEIRSSTTGPGKAGGGGSMEEAQEEATTGNGCNRHGARAKRERSA